MFVCRSECWTPLSSHVSSSRSYTSTLPREWANTLTVPEKLGFLFMNSLYCLLMLNRRPSIIWYTDRERRGQGKSEREAGREKWE